MNSKGITPTKRPNLKRQRFYWSLAALFLCLGGTFLLAGVIVHKTDKHCKESPTTITAKKLAAEGPPVDNWYLHVTDYTIVDPQALCLTGSTVQRVGAELADVKDHLEGYVFPKDGSTSERTIKLYNLNIEEKEDAERFLAQESMDVIVKDPVTLHEYSPNDKVISLLVVDGVNKGGVNASLGLAVAFLALGLLFAGLAKRIRGDDG